MKNSVRYQCCWSDKWGKLVIFSVIGCDERDSALVLFKLNSVHGYDDEDNIERDVEEEGRNRVVINNAAEEDDDDIKYEEEG